VLVPRIVHNVTRWIFPLIFLAGHETNDEETPRGFSENLSEGTKLSYIALTCVSSYTVCSVYPTHLRMWVEPRLKPD